MKFSLEKEGFNVISAHDGLQAIELAYKEEPDLILLDIMLPYKDGLEVYREVRKSHNMPIIMLTALTSKLNKETCFELGVDDLIFKPFSTSDLIARIKATFGRDHRLPRIKSCEGKRF